ncbi:MAG TPA: hypothetical protein VGM41_21085 [Chitinophagaceae bacterium]|jgi:DNA-binding response OmpR family regulator
MKKPEILVIGTNPEILKTILRLLNNKEGWCATGAVNMEEAIAVFITKDFNLVLLGAGLSEDEEQQVRSRLSSLNPSILFVPHYGGGSGLLYAEVMQALG